MKRLATRLMGIAVVVVAATACAWIMFHVLRPQLFSGEEDSLPRYLERAFLHFDFGRSQQGSERPVARPVDRRRAPAGGHVPAGHVGADGRG
ncbi:MAG: hypothetical protein ABW167_03560 [Baekduia sp.]